MRTLPKPPALKVEILIWLVIAAVAVGLRLYVASQYSTYLWTRDSGSYVAPALDWLETGKWITNPRRGPVYSLMIGWILKAGGSFVTVVDWQVAVGLLTAALTVAFARWRLGRAAFWPVAICALFYAAYPLPVYLERLIRNETLLTFLATICFATWRLALIEERPTRERVGWTLASGLAGGLMHAIKGIFPILPLLVIGALGLAKPETPRVGRGVGGVFRGPVRRAQGGLKIV